MNEDRKKLEVIFTICSYNFVSRALLLHESVQKFHPDSRFIVFICDALTDQFNKLPELPNLKFVHADELKISKFAENTLRYNITELNTSIKASCFKYCFNSGFKNAVYLDPDIYLYNYMTEIMDNFSSGVELIVTPHNIDSNINFEKSISLAQFGSYNLGFLAIAFSAETLKLLDWWEDLLMTHCKIDLQNGLFVDQKWADSFSSFVTNFKVLRHPGYNVAYWNLRERHISFNEIWQSNLQALVFVHFSGLIGRERSLISRHDRSLQVKDYPIFEQLLLQYENRLLESKYKYLDQIKYGYSWDGESGINLHTPNPSKVSSFKFLRKVIFRMRFTFTNLIRAFAVMYKRHGSVWIVCKKSIQFVNKNGANSAISVIKQLARSYSRKSSSQTSFTSQSGKPKVLYIDWKIPEINMDAASVTALEILKILNEIGFQITFLPVNLERSSYAHDLEELGIEVLSYANLNNIESWLHSNYRNYDLVFLCRGPVVEPFLDVFMNHSHLPVIIFNSVDLHFIREYRQGQLEKNEKLVEISNRTRNQEFRMIEITDATIVLSDTELDELTKFFPKEKFHLLSLIFSNYNTPNFMPELRRDLVFIGSFSHAPNLDAIIFFLDEIFPLLHKNLPEIRVNIVGAGLSQEVISKYAKNTVIFHGFVENIDEIMSSAKVAIYPLRFGAGVKGKIGTGLMFGVPGVATDIAIEGMPLSAGRDILVGNNPLDFANKLLLLLTDNELWKKISINGFETLKEHYDYKVGKKQLIKLILNSLDRKFEISERQLRNFEDFLEFSESKMDVSKYDMNILEKYSGVSDLIKSFGYCSVCTKFVYFESTTLYSQVNEINDSIKINWREHLKCPRCGLINRQRFVYYYLEKMYQSSYPQRVYITEGNTDFFPILKRLIPNLIGSEFLGASDGESTLEKGIQNENIEALSFLDNSMDLIISLDVLEHVPHPELALSEFYRVLSPGGNLILTVPINLDIWESVKRAELSSGEILHFLPEEIHGNPINKEGSLCFTNFGVDVLEKLEQIGYLDCTIHAIFNPSLGHLGENINLISARKPL